MDDLGQIKRVELWIREISIALCIFVFLYAFVQEIATLITQIELWGIPVYIPILLMMSFPIGRALREALTDIFSDEDIEEAFNENPLIYQYLGVIVLYFMVHFALAFLFTTETNDIKFLNVLSLSLVAGLNSYFICMFYRRYIFS